MLQHVTIDMRINELAARQHGVVTSAQLREIGVDRHAVGRRLRDGRLGALYPRVYAVGPAALRPTESTRLMAATCASGEGAVLSHDSCMAQRGLWNRWSGIVHVSSPRQRRPVADGSFVHHRLDRPLPRQDVEVVDGIPMSELHLTIVQLGQVLTAHQIPFVLGEAVHRRLLDHERLERRIIERCGSRGMAVVRRGWQLWLDGSAGTRSRTEDRLLAALPRHFLEPLVNVRGATGIQGLECDFVWPHRRVVVEVDGSTHHRPHASEQDGQRDDALRREGWRVIRVPAGRVWHELPAVLDKLARVLG